MPTDTEVSPMHTDTEVSLVSTLTMLAEQKARRETVNSILRWATEHQDQLRNAGLIESLLAALAVA